MKIGVRDYLENLGHKVAYNQQTGNVLVDDEKGVMRSINSDAFTLKDDGRYYAESEDDILSALSGSNINYINGYSPVRNTIGKDNSVGYNDITGQITINGRDYNVDGKSLVRIGNVIYGDNKFLKDVSADKFENKYESQEQKIAERLMKDEYDGYNPDDDESYQMAFDSFMKSAKADMGKRGLTSDSLAAYYASQGAEKLMPEYAKMHYEKYRDSRDDLKDAADILFKTDDMRREAYSQNMSDLHKRNEAQSKKDTEIRSEMSKRLTDEETSALERVKLFGYVTKEDAKVLGLPEGTLSYEALNNIAKRQHDDKTRMEENEYDSLKRQEDYRHDFDMENLKHQYREEEAEKDYFYEQEIRKLQSDLDISKAEAAAYYKAIYK